MNIKKEILFRVKIAFVFLLVISLAIVYSILISSLERVNIGNQNLKISILSLIILKLVEEIFYLMMVVFLQLHYHFIRLR